jgi:NAD(P)-dependent dehydrogenase (short-subunit alcohol dehydrogenase family)
VTPPRCVKPDDVQIGRSVLITGGGSGLGAATARALIIDGWRVAIAGRNGARLNDVASELEARGQISAYVVDVTDPDQLDATVTRCRPDALVCCAATLGRGDVWNGLTPERFADTIATNVGGTFHACRSVMREWRSTGISGDIVNVSSLAGIRGRQRFQGFAAYSTSKHAVIGLTEALALDARGSNVRINAIAPGGMRTTMSDGLELEDAVEPARVVPTIEFLLDRDRSGTLTGCTIEISCNVN